MPAVMPAVRTFEALFLAPTEEGIALPMRKRIDACYFQTEGVFTIFKDELDQSLFAVNNDYLIEVRRSDI